MTRKGGRETSPPLFEYDVVVGTWSDGKEVQEVKSKVEQNVGVLTASLGVALPDASVARLTRRDLSGLMRAILLPGGLELPQTGTPAIAESLVSFQERTPSTGQPEEVPDFYLPNVAESGTDGILLGTLKTSGSEFHDFFLQPEDLKRHMAILGMTGSGKSTTASRIVSNLANGALPVMIFDWHNEYRTLTEKAGGKVVAPGKDEFSVNPMEASEGTDQMEHIAMVSDIFSDIYHFTHPQAYMFRNALQKRLVETGPEEVPSISALVKTIESYPLRSAYDNETKVALLRRLVPLTQGQAGKALGNTDGVSMEELLGNVVCIELGYLRDIQTRAVVTDVMLKMIYEEKVRRKSPLDHVTVVEEAKNIVPARRAEDPPSVGERMISELRKFGEGMIFVAQFPSHVASEVVKNSGTKIVHRMGWPDDVSMVGDAMGLNAKQRRHLTRLEAGEAIVSVARIQKPVLVQVRNEGQ